MKYVLSDADRVRGSGPSMLSTEEASVAEREAGARIQTAF